MCDRLPEQKKMVKEERYESDFELGRKAEHGRGHQPNGWSFPSQFRFPHCSYYMSDSCIPYNIYTDHNLSCGCSVLTEASNYNCMRLFFLVLFFSNYCLCIKKKKLSTVCVFKHVN